MRELCAFGAKFRENPVLNLGNIRNQFKKDIDSLVIKLSNKFKLSRSIFKKWKQLLLVNFNDKLNSCAAKCTYRKPILGNLSCRKELDKLRDDYVITVVDKAAGNFAFTCRKFYFMRLAKELGLDNDQPGNETYGFINETEETVVNRTSADVLAFGINPDSRDKKLALLYQTPKFHKNPPKMRFIAGNINTVMSKLDKFVALALKMCKGHFKNLCKKKTEFSGVLYYFDVQTSLEVKEMFSGVQGQANTISINDFSTLYTLFDHNHLLNNIYWLLDKLSKNSGKNFIRIGFDKAWWAIDNSEGITFSVGDIKQMIEYLVRNTHIKAFGSIFRQDRGIIMGGKSSGWLSDCSLIVDEYKYIENKIKSNSIDDVNKLKFFRRYRDDCTSINVQDFLNISRQIYPPSLELTQENDRIDGANVLDMTVDIRSGEIFTKVFCKTDLFPFHVIAMPFIESNLDNRICYKVFYGQIIRYQRLSDLRLDFENRVKYLLDFLIERGYICRFLKREFCRAVEKYTGEFQKWVLPLNFNEWFNDISKITTNT